MDYSRRELRNIRYVKPTNRDWIGSRTALPSSPGWVFLAGAVLAISLSASSAGCRSDQVDLPAAEGEIRALLARQARDWNAGNIAGYMEGYEKSERLRFHSGGDVTLGWQTVHDRYRNRY